MSGKRIQIVDDDRGIRETRKLLLSCSGYQVQTAENGFDALLQLRHAPLPAVIVSDLNMPHMSGFEFLSVVRRRFPQIAVIASSGAYDSSDLIPGGVIADAFYSKTESSPADLLDLIARLCTGSLERLLAIHKESAPVWIPKNGKDSNGNPFVVVTCPDCLRSFPMQVLHEHLQEVQQCECLYCPTKVKYVVDFSRDVISPKKLLLGGAEKARAR